KVKREVRVHPPVRAWKVAITVHVLGEYSSAISMCCQQSVTELVRVETLGEPRHVPGRMVFDVNLPPWSRPPCGYAGIDPYFPGDTASVRKSGRASMLRGLILP